VTTESEAAINQEKEFMERLAKVNSYPLWAFHRDGHRAPPPKAAPWVWRWKEMRALAMEAGDLERIKGQGYRRALLMQNPALKEGGMEAPSSTKTMSSAIQIVWPGEIAEAHRHTAAAIRWVIEGSGAFTVQDGEQFRMEPGDLNLTPSFVYHDHKNPSDEPVIWLDCLDAPMVGFFDAMFQEPFPEDTQPITKPDGYTNASIGQGMMRGVSSEAVSGRALPLNYKWVDAYGALQSMNEGSKYDGIIMEYTNPTTGGHTMPTLACKLQQLRPGFHSDAHKHTSSVVYNVAKGSGSTIIGGKKLDWGFGDTFVVPSMYAHEHINDSTSEDAVLFSMSDLPLLESMVLYQEHHVERQEITGTIG
jgi:gentisate 1,2-dioxygenase